MIELHKGLVPIEGVQEFLDVYHNTPIMDRHKIGTGLIGLVLMTEFYEEMMPLFEKWIAPKLEELYDKKYKVKTVYANSMYRGCFIKEHIDDVYIAKDHQEKFLGTFEDAEKCRTAIIMLSSPEDYQGGESLYGGIRVKFKPGDVGFHDFKTPHSVAHVADGNRVTVIFRMEEDDEV